MSLSIEDRALLVKLFYKKDDCGPAAIKKFRSLNGIKKDCGPISAKSLKNMTLKLEETGSFEVKPGRGRKSIASTSVVGRRCGHSFRERDEQWCANVQCTWYCPMFKHACEYVAQNYALKPALLSI